MANVHLNLTLIKYKNKKEFEVVIEQPAHLTDILCEAGIPPNEVGLVIKNGKWAPINCEVTDNDTIELFPHLSGG